MWPVTSLTEGLAIKLLAGMLNADHLPDNFQAGFIGIVFEPLACLLSVRDTMVKPSHITVQGGLGMRLDVAQ